MLGVDVCKCSGVETELWSTL